MKGFALALALVALGCGDNAHVGPLVYVDPPAGGALRLVKDARSTPTAMVLDLVVGDHALTGYSTGLDLPLDATKVTVGPFTPGTALVAGTAPIAGGAALQTSGPLANTLAVALSQKRTITPTDTTLAPGSVLLSVELDFSASGSDGVVFDGTALGFVLPSGGLRDLSGTTVVAAGDVAIGRLEVLK